VLGINTWFEQAPKVPKHFKIDLTTQPKQQITNHHKNGSENPQKDQFRFGEGVTTWVWIKSPRRMGLDQDIQLQATPSTVSFGLQKVQEQESLRLAISIIKHIWNVTQPRKSQTSQLLCQSFITQLDEMRPRYFSTWSLNILSIWMDYIFSTAFPWSSPINPVALALCCYCCTTYIVFFFLDFQILMEVGRKELTQILTYRT